MTVLTEQQEAAYNAVIGFMASNERCMVIDGYAGTGKSTLIKHIKDEYPEMCNVASLINPNKPKETLRITATTNKAVSNLTINKIQANTIHSELRLIIKNRMLVKKHDRACGHNRLIIIDEASMIDINLYNFLLAEEGTRYIFIGDNTQLPPVNEISSKIYLDNYLEVNLTQVMRQKNSPLLDLITDLREAVVNETDLSQIIPNGLDIQYLEHDEFYQHVLTDMCRPDWKTTHSRLLGFTNNHVINMNKEVATKKTGTYKFITDDVANVNTYFNYNGLKLPTDSMVTIEKVLNDSTIKYRKKTINGYNVIAEGNKLFIPNNYTELKGLMNTEPAFEYFCNQNKVVDLRPLFASTVHKAQGSTINTVYIDLDDFKAVSKYNYPLFKKLLYVAVSRASEKVVFTGDI